MTDRTVLPGWDMLRFCMNLLQRSGFRFSRIPGGFCAKKSPGQGWLPIVLDALGDDARPTVEAVGLDPRGEGDVGDVEVRAVGATGSSPFQTPRKCPDLGRRAVRPVRTLETSSVHTTEDLSRNERHPKAVAAKTQKHARNARDSLCVSCGHLGCLVHSRMPFRARCERYPCGVRRDVEPRCPQHGGTDAFGWTCGHGLAQSRQVRQGKRA